MTCHNCKTEAKRHGFFNGIQRYRCRTCGKTFADIPIRPLDSLRTDRAQAIQVLRLLTEGVGVRAIERLTGLARHTVLNLIETFGAKLKRFHDQTVVNLSLEQVQIDEVYGFVNCKQRNTTIDDVERGDQYTYLSMDRASKLIVNYHVGKRDHDNAFTFVRNLRDRLTTKCQVTSDGFSAYTGYEGAVFQTFKHDVSYAVEVKQFGTDPSKKASHRFNPSVLIGVKRKAQIGDPDLAFATTSHAERTNLSMRLFTRRLTRCTLGYSKTLTNHKHAIATYVAHFNFVRKHSGAGGTTPAHAAGLTDHAWTIEELFEKLSEY